MSLSICGGGEGTCVIILSKFSSVCRNTFFTKNEDFLKIFVIFHTGHTKTTFYFSIKKFPQNLPKSSQKFFAAPSVPVKRKRERHHIFSNDGIKQNNLQKFLKVYLSLCHVSLNVLYFYNVL